MPATSTAPESLETRKAALARDIELSGMDEQAKFYHRELAIQREEVMAIHRNGFDRMEKAIVAQTEALKPKWYDRTPFYIFALFAMSGIMLAYGVNSRDAADAVTTLPSATGHP